MPTKLDDLYHNFYKPIEQKELKSSIEENHKKLIQILSKEEKVLILRIIDSLEMVCNYQSKDSFIQGFKLAFELTTELQNYNDHSIEKRKLNDCGQIFMSQEVQKDEEESSDYSNSYSGSNYFSDNNSLSHRADKHANFTTKSPCVGGRRSE